MKNLSGNEVIIDLNELPYLTGLKDPRKGQLIEVAESMWNKVKSTDYSLSAQYGSDNKVTGSVLLFAYFAINEELNILTLRINPYLEYFINNFTSGHYTSLEFKKFLLTRNKHGKILYRLLAQFFYTGHYVKTSNELKRLMDCPEDYDTRRFNDKILIPAMKSVSELIPNLVLNKRKTGRTISHYEFTFTPQRNAHEWIEDSSKTNADNEIINEGSPYENNFKNGYLPGANSPVNGFKLWLNYIGFFTCHDEYFDMRSKAKSELISLYKEKVIDNNSKAWTDMRFFACVTDLINHNKAMTSWNLEDSYANILNKNKIHIDSDVYNSLPKDKSEQLLQFINYGKVI